VAQLPQQPGDDNARIAGLAMFSLRYGAGDQKERTMAYNTPQRSELSISDGFRFGCGFMMAAAVAYIFFIIFVIASVVFSGLIANYLNQIN
jgi:hypothetical protein